MVGLEEREGQYGRVIDLEKRSLAGVGRGGCEAGSDSPSLYCD